MEQCSLHDSRVWHRPQALALHWQGWTGRVGRDLGDESTMAYIIGRYRVQSYPGWRRVYEEKRPLLRDYGVTDTHVFYNDRDPTSVLLLYVCNDSDHLRAALDSGVVRAWRHDAGTL